MEWLKPEKKTPKAQKLVFTGFFEKKWEKRKKTFKKSKNPKKSQKTRSMPENRVLGKASCALRKNMPRLS
jgi:phage tail tape-measure protein